MDRIRNLRDSLIHHILSFLEIKQIAQTSVLSKQWRYIWTYEKVGVQQPHLIIRLAICMD
ncbi:hypothetical protein MKW98_023189 [Papaver atlanticum]|uniref:F-box domain-containing protein n=1 Tax=Papaver atlanticum TaxID=357466 RepID=A0AAD4SMR6_9MAGN|nr:hypothetical protein MKW98_023189 [Papaver atlanticum]